MSIMNSKKPIFENEKKCPPNRVGVRFHPTEEEIINYFLHHKINGRGCLVDLDVQEIDLLRYHPQDIPDLIIGDGRLWYFFNRLDFKYSNSKRANRKTKGGFWKVTGKVHLIKERGDQEIGGRRTLVYYEDGYVGLKPTKTNWIIHEYQAIPPESNFVLCKLKINRGIPLPSVPNNAAAENQETQAEMHLKNSFSDDDDDDDDDVDQTTFANSFLDLENWPIPVDSEIQETAQHSLSDEKLLVTTCSAGNQNTALNLQNPREDDVDLEANLADSFLDLTDWHYEDYYEEIPPN